MTVLSPALSVMTSSPLLLKAVETADCSVPVKENVAVPSSPRIVLLPPSTVIASAPEPAITTFVPAFNKNELGAAALTSVDSMVSVPSFATSMRPASPTTAFTPPESSISSLPAPATTRLKPFPSENVSAAPISASRLSASVNCVEELKTANPLSPKIVFVPLPTVMLSAPAPPKIT